MSPSRMVTFLGAVGMAACVHRVGPSAAPQLRLSTNPDVRWEANAPRELAIVLENAGSAAIAIPEPAPAQAHVAVFEQAGTVPICSKDSEPPGAPTQVADLAPRERRALIIRLESCNPPPGEYRYEAWYVVPEARRASWSGRVGPEYGRILVQSSAAAIDRPSSRKAVSPPEHAEAPPPPPPANPHVRPAVPPLGPASQACVDRELQRRGLNAYGDPAATRYPEGPPALASEVERQEMLLERYPDLATLCRLPP